MSAIWKLLTNLAAGRLRGFEYSRQALAQSSVAEDEFLLLHNANIIDVNLGAVRDETGVLICNRKVQELVSPQDLESLRRKFPIKREIDAAGRYLIPGLSDIHCHVTLVSEFGAGLREMSYWPAQRLKNSEEILKQGCTLIRDCGGAVEPLTYLRSEIAADRLLGPKILSSTEVITPRGGMWDVGPIGNAIAPLMFGGKMVNFPASNDDVVAVMERLNERGCDFYKTYFEHKPLYGGRPDTAYTMFTPDQARLIRTTADRYGKKVAAHTMFIKGSRLAIEACVDTLEHCTVDECYSPDDAKAMAAKGVAIIPTLTLGGFLAMNCGSRGYPDDPEVQFFSGLRRRHLRRAAEQVALPELRQCFLRFFDWLDACNEHRKMPMVGQVYPDRVHGFARWARDSIRAFQDTGVRVGVGTDGGTGVTFCGFLHGELETLHRYGYSKADVLRMATLGNMEILGLDGECGSLDKGKFADIVVLQDNPLDSLDAYDGVKMVFREGRLLVEQSDGSAPLRDRQVEKPER